MAFSKNFDIKICIDMISFALLLLPIIFILWMLLLPQEFSNEKHPIQEIAAVSSFIPFLFGLFWLIFRHSDKIVIKFPFIMSRWFNFSLVFSILFSIFIIYPIVKYAWNRIVH